MTRVNGLTASSYQVQGSSLRSPPATASRTQADVPAQRARTKSALSTRQAGSGHGPTAIPRPDTEQLKQLVEELNQILRRAGHSRRQVSLALKGEEQERYVVEVRDKDTDRVIMQFPPEAMLDFSAKMQDIVGMVIDEKS
jgi:uncharacterized FlaG/YvyC family protein